MEIMDTRRVENGVERKMIFFEMEAEFRRAGFAIGIGRPLPVAILIDDLFSIVVATSATDPRFDLETFVDEKTYFPTIDRSRIYIYISRFEVNFMLLFNYEIRIITDRTGGCKRGRTRRRLSLPASFSNTFHP